MITLCDRSYLESACLEEPKWLGSVFNTSFPFPVNLCFFLAPGTSEEFANSASTVAQHVPTKFFCKKYQIFYIV